MIMKKPLIIISLEFVLLFICFSCSEQFTSDFSEEYQLSTDFVEIARIDFQAMSDQRYRPSSLLLKGVLEEDQQQLAFLDYRRQECVVFDQKKNSILHHFDLPIAEGCNQAYLVEILTLDSILYLDDDNQEIIFCDRHQIKSRHALNTFKESYPYIKLLPRGDYLRTIDDYVGFLTWIQYGKGGQHVNYDSLMDKRSMVSFFNFTTDSVLVRSIPVKPFIKRTASQHQKYYEMPYFEVNTHRREVLVFHTSSDTIYTYNWDTEEIRKNVITGSSVSIKPAIVPKFKSGAEMFLMYENQERGHHRLYFDKSSGKYIRHLHKSFPVDPLTRKAASPDVFLLQLLGDQFQVEAEMNISDNYTHPTVINGEVYISKFDDKAGELVIQKFSYDQIPTSHKE